MQQTIIQQAQEKIENMTFEQNGIKYLPLGNYALDFKKQFVFLGFTKTGTKAILGDVHSTGPEGVKYNKCYGVIELKNRTKLIDNKPVDVPTIEIHAQGWRYSETVMELIN